MFHLGPVCRCGIPVVLMGETGCGKTRLIRYMCDLASQSSGMKNMLILKVSQICTALLADWGKRDDANGCLVHKHMHLCMCAGAIFKFKIEFC